MSLYRAVRAGLPRDIVRQRLRVWFLMTVFQKKYLMPIPLSPNSFSLSPLQGVSIDITERKRAEERLKLSARIFDNSLESITITNAEKEIIDVNPLFSATTGYGLTLSPLAGKMRQADITI